MTVTHPDYSECQFPPGGGDRCVCGGVRHWHAKAPYGCDDCKSCSEFRPIEDAAHALRKQEPYDPHGGTKHRYYEEN